MNSHNFIMRTIYNLFVKELQNIFDVETQVSEILPRMAVGANSSKLKRIFLNYYKKTEKHLRRVEEVCDENAVSTTDGEGVAVRAMFLDAEEALSKDIRDRITDEMLHLVAKRISCYQISTYQTLVDWARNLNQKTAVKLFESTLDEQLEIKKALSGFKLGQNKGLLTDTIQTERR